MVTDVGGVDDKSFNQSAWEGLTSFGKDNDLKKMKDIVTFNQARIQTIFQT